jgi:hypothetical protein
VSSSRAGAYRDPAPGSYAPGIPTRGRRAAICPTPRFAIWFAAECNAVGLANVARAYADRLAREPCFDQRRRPRAGPSRRHLPKKELGEYRDGKRVPSAVVAFRIGETLHDFGRTYTSGPLALFVAGHDADAIAILGRCSDWSVTGMIFRWADALVRYRHNAPALERAEDAAIRELALYIATEPLRRLTECIGHQGVSTAAAWWFPPAEMHEQRKRQHHRDHALAWLADYRPMERFAYTIAAAEGSSLSARRAQLALLISRTLGDAPLWANPRG